MNEFRNIIFKSDLNGSITPGSNFVWNKELFNLYTWSQNNYVENAYSVDEYAESNTHNNKDYTYEYYNRYTFRPIIEYRE